jgi:2-haloacid dehalogenase
MEYGGAPAPDAADAQDWDWQADSFIELDHKLA